MRLRDLASTAASQVSRFVGRVRELREFSNVVRYVLGVDVPPGGSRLFPHIFLPYGEGGMGKSMLLQQFRTVAIEEGWPETHIVVVDLDYEQYSTPEALAEKLIASVRRKFSDFGASYRQAEARRAGLRSHYEEIQARWARLQAFVVEPGALQDRCRQLREALRNIERQAAPYGGAHMPLDLAHSRNATTQELAWLTPYADGSKKAPANFEDFLGEAIGADATLFLNGEGAGKALAEDLFRLAEERPFLLAIDTYERGDVHDDWLRANVLADASDNMLVIIAGRNRLDEGYGRTFMGDLMNLVSSYNLNDQKFQVSEVAEYLRIRLGPAHYIDHSLVDEVLAISRGVPVAVEALGDQLAATGDLERYRGIELETLDRRAVVRAVTRRFLRYAIDDDADTLDVRTQKREDRQHIRCLSILLRPDAELACAFWGTTARDGQQKVEHLADQHSFIFAGNGPYEMHDLVREFVREETRMAGKQTFEWPAIEAGLWRVLTRVNDKLARLAADAEKGEQRWSSNPEERFRNPDWQAATLDRLNILLWLSEFESARKLLIESVVGAKAFAAETLAEEALSLSRELAPKDFHWSQLLTSLQQSLRDSTQLAKYGSYLDSQGQAVLNYYRSNVKPRGWLWLEAIELDESNLAELNSQLTLLEQALSAVPGWKSAENSLATVHLRLAWNFYRQAQHEKAKFHIEAAHNLASADFDMMDRKLLADMRWRTESNPIGAISILDSILEKKPDDTQALHIRAHARSTVGDSAGAIADFERAQELEPDDTTHIVCCANCRKKFGDYAGAIHDIDRALELVETDSPNLLKTRAGLKGESADIQGAIDDLERLLALEPDNVFAFVSLAFRKYQLCNAAMEPAELEAVAARDLRASAYMMGCLRAHQGRTEEALRWLKLSLGFEPSDRSWMPKDPDLRLLHDDPSFQAMISGPSLSVPMTN